MFVVDTNILVHACVTGTREHEACAGALERWRRRPGRWYLTWNVIYEFLRVVTHRRALERPLGSQQAWSFVRALLDSPPVGVLLPTDRHTDILEACLSANPELAGNVLHDAHTAVLMREHGIRAIYTRDTDFHRFDWVEVLDPLDR